MFRKIIVAVAVIIAMPFVVALFIQQDYSVTRTITIDKPVAEVFDYVKHLKNQDNFSQWAQIDPDMVKIYHGTDATVGFVSAWASEHPDVGVGEQQIIAIEEGKRIDFELRFISPFEATAPAYMTTEAVNANQTKVNWGFSGHFAYPTNLMLLFVDFKTMIGADLQQGLDTLKVVLEQ
ncbi:SRPBCC family protein [Shewanella livingstonensis]|uniref:Polyketide cyclase n=1 Tax=Shewanella livingstonensis TaxID=150120 RepID=A0A3G8LYQ6_9GAMM|nr:SRPBCC family protein [Shewanella livingstonensis]AZG74751.1 polyketide cyclase [Shewanella livingstonensis]